MQGNPTSPDAGRMQVLDKGGALKSTTRSPRFLDEPFESIANADRQTRKQGETN
jgi:hypothetical protein